MTKVLVDRDGVVRVTDAALAAAGTTVPDGDIARLTVTLRDKEVPTVVRSLPRGSADGRFEILFLGQFPRGEKTWEDEYTSTNVYVVSVAPPGAQAKRIVVERLRYLAAPGTPRVSSPHHQHFETNAKLVRFSGRSMPAEPWFWAEIRATDAEPTKITVTVRDVTDQPATLKARLMGYSQLPANPDHTVDVKLNGRSLGQAVWDGESAHEFEAELPAGVLAEGDNLLTFQAHGEKTDGIDVVLLDWVEVSYQRRHSLTAEGQVVVQAEPQSVVRVEGAGDTPVLLWDAAGTRALEIQPRAGAVEFVVPGTPGPGLALQHDLRAVRADGALVPRGVVVSHPADLRAAGQGAEFVIISHELFLPAAERLAATRRAEGLATQVVAVSDIYDRFRGGMLHPDAIRDFLKHAWATFSPRPRYVLLIGDASWDFKREKISDTDYWDWHWQPQFSRTVPKNSTYGWAVNDGRNTRLFVPTYQYQSPYGHAASDNYFACVSSDTAKPDLAIGRWPVATLAEANDIVDKTLAYGALAANALSSAVFITSDDKWLQNQTDTLAATAAEKGYAVQKVYPRAEDPDNSTQTATLLGSFDGGPAMVVFNGHGGRYIWRTGWPDLTKNHDLFTLDDLDNLQPTTRLPVVLSLTCYSAPFDHPLADSIGEKLLRIKERGAIVVVASSWRNVPPLELGRRLITGFGDKASPRIGDVFLAAKRVETDEAAIATYNMLGDPTVIYRGPEPASRAPAAGGAPATPGATR